MTERRREPFGSRFLFWDENAASDGLLAGGVSGDDNLFGSGAHAGHEPAEKERGRDCAGELRGEKQRYISGANSGEGV